MGVKISDCFTKRDAPLVDRFRGEGRDPLKGSSGVSIDSPPHQFPADRLQRIGELERWHFWFVGRRILLDKLLRKYLAGETRQVLDLGCGTGRMVEHLLEQGHQVVGLDIRSEGLATTRLERADAKLVQADAIHLPLGVHTFDAVLILDLLEHVDDQSLMGEVRRILRPGGVALMTVPAMPWLWSYRDAAAGHRRRYTRRRLARLLDEAGFTPLKMRYYQCLLFPFLVLSRLLGRKGPKLRDAEERPPRRLNAILTWITLLEVKLGDRIPWPWGSSLVVACRRG